MGEIRVEVQLENSLDQGLFRRGYTPEHEIRRQTITAVADSGALFMALPQDVVAALGLSHLGDEAVMYADGSRDRVPKAGDLTVEIAGRRTTAECVVIPAGVEPLVGQLVLEALDLILDPRNQTMGPRPESPDYPLARL